MDLKYRNTKGVHIRSEWTDKNTLGVHIRSYGQIK